MAKTKITTEQRESLNKFIAGIGHNQGPVLEPYINSIPKHLAKHRDPSAEPMRIRVILDLMRSHLAGDYLLSKEKTA